MSDQAPPKKTQRAERPNWAEFDDLFLKTKGKLVRNKQKKLDKIKQTEKIQRKGDVKPNQD